MVETDNQIQAVGLDCIRSERVLFQGLGFTLRAGEVLHVRGINGSGKSSLLRILCGLLAPQQGEVYWNGQDILAECEHYFSQMAYLGHLHGMKDELTVSENLAVGMALAACSCSAGEMKAALGSLGLSAYADSLARRLSAGQKRRLAMARFLLTDAPLWIMDEPFTSLDDVGRELVCALISGHVRRGGLCVVASHEPLPLTDVGLTGLDL